VVVVEVGSGDAGGEQRVALGSTVWDPSALDARM
jgi:hypothetical protein